MNGSTINNLDAGDYCIASTKRPVIGGSPIVGERFHGGRLDRRWIRVSTIGGIRGADKERADWETTYYPDIVLKGKTNEH